MKQLELVLEQAHSQLEKFEGEIKELKQKETTKGDSEVNATEINDLK